MRRLAALLGVVLLALSVTACGPQVTAGVVVDKNHYESYETLRYVCYSYGKYGQCTYSQPTWDYHPERFELVIEGYAEGEREPRQSSYNVSETTYDSVDIGDDWTKEDA